MNIFFIGMGNMGQQRLSAVEKIQDICVNRGKSLVVYLSMGFGNPYGDAWDIEILKKWSDKLFNNFGVEIQALSDTIGISTPSQIEEVFSFLASNQTEIDYGAHIHTSNDTAIDKINAAYKAGCNRFDVAMNGIGGCPMAKDDLVGNMSTQNLIRFFDENKIETSIDLDAYNKSVYMADQLFS